MFRKAECEVLCAAPASSTFEIISECVSPLSAVGDQKQLDVTHGTSAGMVKKQCAKECFCVKAPAVKQVGALHLRRLPMLVREGKVKKRR
jgi:hypothetical protein